MKTTGVPLPIPTAMPVSAEESMARRASASAVAVYASADSEHNFAHERAYTILRLRTLATRPRVAQPEDDHHKDAHCRRHHGCRRQHDCAELPVAVREDEPCAETQRRELPDRNRELLPVDSLHECDLLAQKEREGTRRMRRVVKVAYFLANKRADRERTQVACEVLAGRAEDTDLAREEGDHYQPDSNVRGAPVDDVRLDAVRIRPEE
eukprot:scaffold274353_cov30-Tisochrysis_lutea.AAC.2